MTNVPDKEILRGMYLEKPSTKSTINATQEINPNNNNNSSLKRLLDTEVVKNKVYGQKRKLDVRKKIQNHLDEIVQIQEILYALSEKNPEKDQVQMDFLSGQHGAPLMTRANLNVIEKFHQLTTSGKRAQSIAEAITFLNTPDLSHLKESEHFKLLMEGSDTTAEGTSVTFREAKFLLQRARQSGYFDPFRFRTSIPSQEVKQEAKKVTGTF